MTRNPDLYPSGCTDDQASAVLRGALEGAWSTRPDEVLAACCATKLRSRSLEMAARPGQFSEYVYFLKDRLWLNNEKGHIPEAGDKERGPSAFGIRYWDPKAGGLASYMRARVTWLDADWATEQSAKHNRISTDLLASQGAELTESGEFVRPQRLSNIDDADASEVAAEGVDLREERSRLQRDAGMADRADAGDAEVSKEDVNRSESEADVVARGRADRLDALRRSPGDEIVLNSPNRGEFAFFSVALARAIEPLDTPEDREGQLRGLASETLDKLCRDMPDLDDVRSALPDWEPGKNSFFRYFPEVSEFVVEKVSKPERVLPAVDQNVEALGTFMGLAGNKVARDEGTGATKEPEVDEARLDEPAGFFAHHEMGADTLRASAMWKARATEQTINNPDRPDYLFLCDRLNIEPREDIEPEEMNVRLKEMSLEWLTSSSRNKVITQALYPAIKAWNPSEGFMGETMMEHLSDIARRRVNEVAQPAPREKTPATAMNTLASLRGENPALAPEMMAAELEKRLSAATGKSRSKKLESNTPDFFSSGDLSL